MLNFITLREALVWLLLVTATIITWQVAEGEPLTNLSRTLLVAVSAFKVRLVIRQFMQLRSMPRPWQVAFDGWIMLAASIILIGFHST